MVPAILPLAEGRDDVWVDMESSLRTVTADSNDVFDISKCFACAMAVVDLGIKSGGLASETHAPSLKRSRTPAD